MNQMSPDLPVPATNLINTTSKVPAIVEDTDVVLVKDTISEAEGEELCSDNKKVPSTKNIGRSPIANRTRRRKLDELADQMSPGYHPSNAKRYCL